jgi:hypothetical protein
MSRRKPAEPLTTFCLDAPTVRLVDQWRVKEGVLLNRSAAIRKLITLGVMKVQAPPPQAA